MGNPAGQPAIFGKKKLNALKIMEFEIYLQDLKDEWLERIREALKYELADEITEAVKAGIDRQTAEDEIIDYCLNAHNFSAKVKL